MKLDDAIENRKSVRAFSNKKVRWDKVLEAIDSALKAPQAGNVNHLQYIIVSDEKKKERLAECSQQDWIADATYIVVVCSDISQLKRLYDDEAENYSTIQTGAAIENFLLKITDMKLGSCWVGAFLEDYVKEELKIPKKIKVEALLPVGNPSLIKKPKKHKKDSLEKAIYWESYGERKKPIPFKDPSTW